MLLTVKDYTIPDFLSALGFIAPSGFTVESIISPKPLTQETTAELADCGYSQEPTPDLLTNVTYLKKDLKQTHSFSQKSNQIEDPNLLSPEFPKAAPVPMDPNLGNNNQIMTPKRGIIIAECIDTEFEKSFALREDFCGLSKNTIFILRG